MFNKKQAFGYARVSTKMQVEDGHSIETQHNLIEKYCKKEEIPLIKIYVDKGISAKDYINRPDFNQLLNDITPNTIVVATDIDRITRSVKDLQTIVEVLKIKGAHLVLLDFQLDTSTTGGSLLLNMMVSVAEFERKHASERVAKYMNDQSRKGKLRTKPKFGYKVIDGVLAPVPEEQYVINRIREIIEEEPDIPIPLIINVLNSEHITMRKAKKLYHDKIKDIIINNNLRPNVSNHFPQS